MFLSISPMVCPRKISSFLASKTLWFCKL
jgi:hypothetical protein